LALWLLRHHINNKLIIIRQRQLEEEDNIIVKWAQEDVEILYSLLNKLLLSLLLSNFSLLSFGWEIFTYPGM